MSLVPVFTTCSINGYTYRVHGTSIELALDTTSQYSFYFDVDANELAPTIRVGLPIILTQNGNGVQVFTGLLTQVSSQRGVNYTRYAVTAKDLSSLALGARFLVSYGSMSASDLVEQAWETYGPSGVTLDIESGAPWVDEYTSTYQSLADLMNYVTSTTGWAWTLWDGTLHFFDPLGNMHSSVSQGEFEAGSLDATVSLDNVVNVARQPAFNYLEVPFDIYPSAAYSRIDPSIPTPTPSEVVNQCTTAVFSSQLRNPQANLLGGTNIRDWQYVGANPVRYVAAAPVPQGGVSFSFNESDLTLESDTALNRGFPPNVVATFRREVWVEVIMSGSIALYGRREAPTLNNDGGMGVPEALRRLGEYLRQRAYPAVELRGDYLKTNIYPGERRRFSIPEFGIDQDLVVESVTRVMDQDDLRVSIIARSIIDSTEDLSAAHTGVTRAAAPRPHLMPEIFRRLERMETADLDPRTILGRVWEDQDPIREAPSFTGPWEWAGRFAADNYDATFFGDWTWYAGFFSEPIGEPVVFRGAWEWAGRFEVLIRADFTIGEEI